MFIFNCVQPDTEPPVVTIHSPENGSIHSELLVITCSATDNEAVDKVELWVDGVPTGIEDKTSPYQLEWNTSAYPSESSHVLTVRAHDESDNQADSQPVTILLDHSETLPEASDLNPIQYEADHSLVSWSRSTEGDFLRYDLFELDAVDLAGRSLIFSTELPEDTSYVITSMEKGVRRYFEVETVDEWGLTSTSNTVTWYQAPRLLTAHFVNDWMCPDCGEFTIMVSDREGRFIAQETMTGNALIEIDPPQGLYLDEDEITVTVLRDYQWGELRINTYMNVPLSSTLYWSGYVSAGQDYEGNVEVNLTNRPEHSGYLYSSQNGAGWSNGGWVNSRLNLGYYGDPLSLYIKMRTAEDSAKFFWVTDLTLGEYEFDLSDVGEAGVQNIDFNGVAYRYWLEFSAFENPGERSRRPFMLDRADGYEDLFGSVNIFYPPDVFSDFQTDLMFYDNDEPNDGAFWHQITFGEIPEALERLDVDFDFLHGTPDHFEIRTSNANFNLLNSIWRTVNDGWLQTWHVSSSPYSTEYALPEFSDSLLARYPYLDRQAFVLRYTSVEDYRPMESYEDVLGSVLSSDNRLTNELEALRTRVKQIYNNTSLRGLGNRLSDSLLFANYREYPRWFE